MNKQSAHFDWAVDFLQFISSHRINERFAERAGWLPVITGAKAPESVAAFMPIPEGLPKSLSLSIATSTVPSNIRNAWSANVKLYKTGDIDYAGMAAQITETLESPIIGIERAWSTSLQKAQDSSRANQRSISVERMRALLGSEDAAAREKASTYLNLIEDEGVHLKRWWQELHPEQSYPKL